MNTFKKIFGKPKKDGANFNNESHANRRARVRRSRSMPFRSSSDTDDSTFRVRPVYRGQRPLKASDVQLVLDISAEAVARDQGRYPNIPYQLRNYAEKDLIDLFPAPPTTVAHNVIECDTTTSRPTRRLSPNNFVTEDDLLPPLPPNVVAHNQRLKEEREREQHQWERQRIHGRTMSKEAYTTQSRLTSMQRSNSSASGYYTSTLSNTTNYIPDLSGRPKPAVRHDGHVHPPSITSHPNFSTQSLGGNAHLKSGPVSYRPTVQHSQASASTASVATFGIDPLRLCKKTSKAPVSNPCRAHMEVVSADSMSRVNHPLPFKGGEFGYRTTEVQDTRTFKTNAATHQGKPSGSRIVRP